MTLYTEDQILQLKQDDMKYLLHPTSSIAEIESWGGPKVIAEGQGIRIKSIEGKSYIDCGAGLWLNNVGLGRTELADAAKNQMESLSYFQTFNGYSHLLAIKTAKKVSSMIPIDNARIFFTSGGSESNDTAYKLARLYWYLKGLPSKNNIIARTKAYHGVSYGAVSATSLPGFWDGFKPLVPGFHHIEHPHCYFCPWGKEQGNCNLECTVALEDKILELGEDNVAAFTAEPVIGTGGCIVPPEGYYQRIKEICTQYDVLFIADEVITGFGRTGKMFGMQHWGVQPDIMMMAKGITSGYIPLGAVGISERIYEPIKEHGSLMHGYTYSGHPVACAVALKNIEIIERENLVQNAQEKGELLRSSLRNLGLTTIGDVRGLGMMNAVQLIQNAEHRTRFDPALGFAKRVSALAWENGLALRPLVDDVLQLSPSLTISETEIVELVSKLGRSIEQAQREFLGK